MLDTVGFQTFCHHILLVKAKFSSLILINTGGSIHTEDTIAYDKSWWLNGEVDNLVSL